MLIIITAVHNQLAMNELFWQSLNQYTAGNFKLIIIDNASTDGSADFFIKQGAIVIRNEHNYSYPYTQNQGIAYAKQHLIDKNQAHKVYFAFLNNDIIVAPNWNRQLIETMQYYGLEVATCCGLENMGIAGKNKPYKRRWQLIKNMLGLFGYGKRRLKLMHTLMYVNWSLFCQRWSKLHDKQICEGFVGNTVIIAHSALEKIGLWDETQQAADFDLYLRTKQRQINHQDMMPVHIILQVFNHHYIRLTSNKPYPPFYDLANLSTIDAKWGKQGQQWLSKLKDKKVLNY